jgi:hypothetical protein
MVLVHLESLHLAFQSSFFVRAELKKLGMEMMGAHCQRAFLPPYFSAPAKWAIKRCAYTHCCFSNGVPPSFSLPSLHYEGQCYYRLPPQSR